MLEYNQFWRAHVNVKPRDYVTAFAFTLGAIVVSSLLFFPIIWTAPLTAIALLSIPSFAVMGGMWILARDATHAYPQTEGPLINDKNVELMMSPRESKSNRNTSFIEKNQTLFMKQAEAMDVLSEVAGKEMADLMGLSYATPKSTVAKNPDSMSCTLLSQQLFPSREAMLKLGIKRPKTQDLVGKYLFNLKTAMYRKRVREGMLSKLLFIQDFIPHAKNGIQWFSELCSHGLENQSQAQKEAQRVEAKLLLNSIDQYSFEEHVLLHIILGSEDANLGNTLFVRNQKDEKTRLYSVDLERIMPEDNYNVTKRMLIRNGPGEEQPIIERCIKNVFPMRIWLLGLPQADVPFSKATMKKMLRTLDSKRLIAYHHRKKLFTSEAVTAQLDRVQCIRNAFETACKQTKITLTPKALFDMFAKQHPSYAFLKNILKSSDFFTYLTLGYIPEYSDERFAEHPLHGEMLTSIRQNKQTFFSEESFGTSAAPRVIFFQRAAEQIEIEQENKDGLDILKETSAALLACP